MKAFSVPSAMVEMLVNKIDALGKQTDDGKIKSAKGLSAIENGINEPSRVAVSHLLKSVLPSAPFRNIILNNPGCIIVPTNLTIILVVKPLLQYAGVAPFIKTG